MNENIHKIASLANGARSSVEIANIVGLSPRYVRKVLYKYNLPRLSEGAQAGLRNHQFHSGRRIDLDGYVLVTAEPQHQYARKRPGRTGKILLEHRLVFETALGRYLQPYEVIDHIDGLTLHNALENLRLFSSNGQHLQATTSGRTRLWSAHGRLNIGARTDLGRKIEPVDSYSLRRAAGDVRLRQILLAAWKLGVGSQYLLGTIRHTKKTEIDLSSRSKIERALVYLYEKWGWGRAQLQQELQHLDTLQVP